MKEQACITGHHLGSKFRQTRCAILMDVRNSIELSCTD